MKLFISAAVFFLTLLSVEAQNSSVQKQLDSLKIVHSVCIIKEDLKVNMEQKQILINKKMKLNSQLQDIESFKIGRTKLEKEKQLNEISSLILSNNNSIQENLSEATLLNKKLWIAEEKVSKL